MALVKSTIYPNLWVHDLGVRFVDGVAEVKDRKALDALASMDGIEVPKAQRVKQDPESEE